MKSDKAENLENPLERNDFTIDDFHHGFLGSLIKLFVKPMR